MDNAEQRIREMLERYAERPVRPEDEADLFGRLAIDGDDASEFMDEFARTFAVDLSAHRWYFHSGEEGWGLGGLFFPPPYKRVSPIPIDLTMLLTAARTQRWPSIYPEHSLPKIRWDLYFNQVLSLVILVTLIAIVAGNWMTP